MMIILGIDPGLATTGYGLIEVTDDKKSDVTALKALDYGIIATSKDDPLEERLLKIHESLCALLESQRIRDIAIERLFFGKNKTTGISVAHARGVILMTCAKYKFSTFAYTPQEIKKVIKAPQHTDKMSTQLAIQRILRLSSIPKPDDAADGLALALCHWAKKIRPKHFIP